MIGLGNTQLKNSNDLQDFSKMYNSLRIEKDLNQNLNISDRGF